ncbi:unnamed protein product [Prorocentrum cordatum]|uniref:Uncharacterized protein n=1 Tax=Prorocentrum cordatum TaxID=2364126 RepID=A0ABN9VPV4_9DINO|nr:unnamed protein product [Polarella glacialis]
MYVHGGEARTPSAAGAAVAEGLRCAHLSRHGNEQGVPNGSWPPSRSQGTWEHARDNDNAAKGERGAPGSQPPSNQGDGSTLDHSALRKRGRRTGAEERVSKRENGALPPGAWPRTNYFGFWTDSAAPQRGVDGGRTARAK